VAAVRTAYSDVPGDVVILVTSFIEDLRVRGLVT